MKSHSRQNQLIKYNFKKFSPPVWINRLKFRWRDW